MISFCDCLARLISDFEALAAMYTRSTSISDREIFHRDVAFALKVAEQMIAAEPEISGALTGGNLQSPTGTGRPVCHPTQPFAGRIRKS
jgi:hypothetical protein